MDGILLLDKPEGLTSATAVREVKRVVRAKIGHLGTLDPFASGLLPLVLGEGTKVAQFLNTAGKRYAGVIHLGSRTDTGDRTGTVIEESPLPSPLTRDRCDAVARSFLGEGLQTPPMHSAVKQKGVPLYKLARQGIAVERQPRRVNIEDLALEPRGGARLGLEVRCSKGTYIRVLAEEIAASLGSVGHLESLRRTQFGHFRIDQCVQLPLTPERCAEALITPRQALAELAEVLVDEGTALRVRRGQVAVLQELPAPHAPGDTLKVIGPDEGLLAVVQADSAGRWQFARVLGAGQTPNFTR